VTKDECMEAECVTGRRYNGKRPQLESEEVTTWRLTMSGEPRGIEEPQDAMTEYAAPASVCCCKRTREETNVYMLYHQVVTGERTAKTGYSGSGKRERMARTRSRELVCSQCLGERVPLVRVVSTCLSSVPVENNDRGGRRG